MPRNTTVVTSACWYLEMPQSQCRAGPSTLRIVISIESLIQQRPTQRDNLTWNQPNPSAFTAWVTVKVSGGSGGFCYFHLLFNRIINFLTIRDYADWGHFEFRRWRHVFIGIGYPLCDRYIWAHHLLIVLVRSSDSHPELLVYTRVHWDRQELNLVFAIINRLVGLFIN